MKRIVLGIIGLLVALPIATTVFAEELTPQLCKEKAMAAAKLVGEEGEAAFDKLRDPNGPFRFADGAGYIWVHDLEGVMLMHPIKPSLEGKGLLDLTDINGNPFFMSMNEIVMDNGAGWVPYLWPKPGEEESSSKVSYVVLVEKDGKELVVGSGMYDVTADDIREQFPGDPVWEEM